MIASFSIVFFVGLCRRALLPVALEPSWPASMPSARKSKPNCRNTAVGKPVQIPFVRDGRPRDACCSHKLDHDFVGDAHQVFLLVLAFEQLRAQVRRWLRAACSSRRRIRGRVCGSRSSGLQRASARFRSVWKRSAIRWERLLPCRAAA